MTGLDFALIGLASVAGGAVNALAGGGTLITFPTLIALGIPAVASNVTNTVALCPGYLGGTLAQWRDLGGQKSRLWLLAPVGALGGVAGGILLLKTGEQMFRVLVPYLILFAALLLAVQDKLRNWVFTPHAANGQAAPRPHAAWIWMAAAVFFASIYGGYFGAGLSVIVLAVLGLVLEDTLTRLNALKQTLALVINIAAAIFFLFSGQVVWSVMLVMALSSLLGGVLGGWLAGWVRPGVLRLIVVIAGVVIAVIYFVR